MYKDTDIAGVDESIVQLPQDIRDDMRQRGLNDLYYFTKGILRNKDMTFNAHGPLCAFLQYNKKNFKRILMPRDHLKTSVGTIGGNIWKAVSNPNRRILIANEAATNAERMLRGIRQHCESNRVFRALYGQVIPKDFRKVRWNDSELDFIREDIFPEPTFDTIGMTGSVTSRHYSDMCFDDPISEEAVKSDKVMADVINRMTAITSLLTDAMKDEVWLLGTRWALHDVYSWFDAAYGDWVGKFGRSVIDPEGNPIWPERFPVELIAKKRSVMGAYKFSCLMMNNPQNVELQILPVEQLRYWDWVDAKQDQIVLFDHLGVPCELVMLDKLDITITVDPAPSEKTTSDYNALSVMGMTPGGKAIVLEVVIKRCDPLAVIEEILRLTVRWSPRVVGIEAIAYQKTFKYFISNEAERRGIYVPVRDLKNSSSGKNKNSRIKSLQPMMATGRLFMHKSQQMCIQQMADYPLGEFDDGPDTLSMHSEVAQFWYNTERVAKLKAAEIAAFRNAARPAEYRSSRFDNEEEDFPDFPVASLSNFSEVTLP